MKVKDLMTTEVKFCGLETNLAAATELMWNNDCGILPIVEAGQVIGVITDRDICIALGTRKRHAAEVVTASVISPNVFVCSADDDVKTALATMKKQRVRRLPVTDENGALVGIVSLDDVVIRAERGGAELSYGDIVSTYRALCERQLAVRGTAG